MCEQKGINEPPNVREPSVMLSDITSDLIWPRILRAPALALSPSRVLTGSICAFLLSIILQIATFFRSEKGQSTQGIYAEIQGVFDRLGFALDLLVESIFNFNPIGFAQSIGLGAWLIRDTVMESPMISLFLGIPLIVVLSIAGGAIARSSAIEFGTGRFVSSEDTLRFALRRARHFVGAIVGPMIVCTFIFLLIAIGGVLLSVPVLDVIGSILYLPALILGILATIILMLHLLALPMIVPALAVEGTDAFDAIQRSYAYVIAKPLRYLIYAVLLLGLGIASAGIFTMLAQGSIEMTNWAASFFALDSTSRVLTNEGEMGATKGTAHAIISIWHAMIELITAGYAISLFFTSSTLLYLVTRRVCDGQGINELWDGKEA